MSLLPLLKTIPGPRSRRRLECPLHGMLVILILAVAHGEEQWREDRKMAFRWVGG
ncbi:MAG: hypothetical protein ACK4VW_00170 [Anaerolineales bacterium]